ncbi:type I-F CRISPR-associated protein Csy2 [Pseudomonas asplenii]|uniref:type I-F CRISPR-associated protein Csy2 n=1 Tax=Pseudomonas asplenii TaxID=53407 RepID=UPI0006B5DFCE|nr:type I-F CRISPR-associated protein Csy2 [Pseudomonas fuscovaginae]KPA98242.1 CRISPR type I-F/YPEST-associated protein Csy2 [Pseudomonas fuscovaginae]
MADSCPHFDYLLVIPRIQVQNANSLSSPLTHGFPSMTAFLGLMWALERKVREAGLDVQFNATTVVAHRHEEQVTTEGYVQTLRLTRNPINRDGSTAAIVEEGRIHLEISLVFGIQSESLNTSQNEEEDSSKLALQVRDILSQMRIAGGSVIPSRAPLRKQRPFIVSMVGEDGRDELFRKIKLSLLPGFVLVDRTDLLEQRHQEQLALDPDASKLDTWLSLSRVNWTCTPGEPEQKAHWENDRKGKGWIVPIPIGYGALGDVQDPGAVTHARDAQTSFRFVESLYSVGEWISPHRLHSAKQMLWYADSAPEEWRYRCRNDYRSTSPDF